jgi:hypothetical protein
VLMREAEPEPEGRQRDRFRHVVPGFRRRPPRSAVRVPRGLG